jgi:hypothetical protein
MSSRIAVSRQSNLVVASRTRLAMILWAGALGLYPSRRVGAQALPSERSRPIGAYVTGMFGIATGSGKCPDGPCFPSAPMIFTLSGGARLRLASFGAHGGTWASLGIEHTRLPLFLSTDPTPTAWLAAGRITVGARTRAALAGSTGSFRRGDTRGRIVQWRVHVEHRHGLAFAGVTQLRAMQIYANTPTAGPRPFEPRLVVFGSGLDF